MDLLMELLDAPAMQDAVDAPTVAPEEDTLTSAGADNTRAALRFITCGSVDDGKSTLIGRLLLDSRNVLQDQLANVSRSGTVDLAQFTDGLSAEREQGITIDVAYRYCSSARRKFIIGDTPGHEQYTRNMVTAASNADAAVVLVDATKLPWHADAPAAQPQQHPLLPQTRRHSLLARLLRVPAIVFAVNKLDAVTDPALAFANIGHALQAFCAAAGIPAAGIVPISALHGNNVVTADPGWCGYRGPALLQLLEQLPAMASENTGALAFPVQWVEKLADDGVLPGAGAGRRVLWGRVATGQLAAGQSIVVMPGGQSATVAQVLDHGRRPATVCAGSSAAVLLDRALDVSRGDWLLAHGETGTRFESVREVVGTVAWLDDTPLQPGRTYWAVHGHRWVKARVTRITHQLDIHTLERLEASELGSNAIGEVALELQSPMVVLPYAVSRALGALVLVDTTSHKTAGAVLLH